MAEKVRTKHGRKRYVPIMAEKVRMIRTQRGRKRYVPIKAEKDTYFVFVRPTLEKGLSESQFKVWAGTITWGLGLQLVLAVIAGGPSALGALGTLIVVAAS